LKKILLLALIISLMLCGCATQKTEGGEILLTRSAYTPRQTSPKYVTLYYPSSDGKSLLQASQQIEYEGSRLYSAVMSALLSGTEEGYVSPFPDGVSCRSIMQLQNILYIDMSWQLARVEEAKLLSLVAVLTETFTSFSGISFVNITVEGQQLTAPTAKVPIMLLSRHTGTVESLTSRYGSGDRNKEGYVETFYACLYTQDDTKKYILPRAQSVTAQNGDYGSAILASLLAYDDGERLFSEDISLKEAPEKKGGTLYVKLLCASSWEAPANWLAPQAIGAALDSVYGNCEYLSLTVEDAGGSIKYNSTVQTVSCFDFIRSSIDIFTPNSSGNRLTHSSMLFTHTVDVDDAKSFVLEYICTLYPAFRENDGIINSVTVTGDTAVIDLGSQYFEHYVAQAPDASQEYAIVYSLVATACSYFNTRRVMLLEDHQVRSTFAGNISLSSSLLNIPTTYLNSLK